MIDRNSARQNALSVKKRQHKTNVKRMYRGFLTSIRKYSRRGHFGIESRYMQLMPNLDGYIALRLLKLKTDFEVRIYCDDEEFADNGRLNYGKWAHENFGNWDTRFKYIINW